RQGGRRRVDRRKAGGDFLRRLSAPGGVLGALSLFLARRALGGRLDRRGVKTDQLHRNRLGLGRRRSGGADLQQDNEGGGVQKDGRRYRHQIATARTPHRPSRRR